MGILLIGEAGAERAAYFRKAADAMGIALDIMPMPQNWQGFDCSALAGCAVKIDPPDLHSVHIDELGAFGLAYTRWLADLQGAPDVRYLNTPEAIAHTLDKARCKRSLLDGGVSTAPMLGEVRSLPELRAVMAEKRLRSVFVKPRYGSGAAGVAAFRRNPETQEEIAYTAAQRLDGRLCNTRKLRRVRDPQEIGDIIGGILACGALVEQWIPKAGIGGMAFDIRAVWQFGRIEYAVARLSRGAVTNLHLGGSAASLEALRLNDRTLHEVEALCGNAVSCFPGLRAAGVDILLEQNTHKPYVIEINGQGDLLHRDIRGENRIYTSQVAYLASL